MDDPEMQHKLGLRAFLKAVPESIGRELRRKHFVTLRQELEEARFLRRVQEEEMASGNKVLTLDQEGAKTPASA